MCFLLYNFTPKNILSFEIRVKYGFIDIKNTKVGCPSRT